MKMWCRYQTRNYIIFLKYQEELFWSKKVWHLGLFPTEKVNGSGIYDIDQQRHLPQMEIQEKLGVMQYKILPVLTSSYQLKVR